MTTKTKVVDLRWYHKLLLIGFSLMLAVLLVELAARALGLLPPLSDAEYRAFSRRVGTLRPPYDHFTNTDFVEGNTEFRVKVRLNKLGFHGDDIPKSPPEGARRVLVMGDSYTAEWEVEAGEMWSAWLERWLDQSEQSYDVANLGFPGLGTDREYLIYQSYGHQLKPDVILLVMYVENDVNDNGIALWESPSTLVLARPYFTLDGSGALVEHPWRYVDKTRSFEDQPFPRNVTGWLNAHSLSYRLIRDEARAVWSAAKDENTDKTAVEPGEPPVDPNHPTRISLPLEVLFSQPDAKWEEAWRITGALLAAFRATVEADGATFVVAIVPPHMIVQNEYWSYTDLFNASGRAWDLWYAQNRMMALLNEQGIPVINPTQDFIDMRAQTGKNPFYMRDRHFNPMGTCWFGTLMGNGLMERGIVAADAAYPRDPMAVCER